MKHITILLFLLLPLFGWAQQNREIIADTSYIEWDAIPSDWAGPDDSIWYEIRNLAYSGGRTETVRQPVGDTSTTLNYFANRSVDLNRQLSNAAALTIQRAAVVRANRVTDKALTGQGLPSIFEGIDTLFWREYLKEGVAENLQNYTVTENGVDYAATMRRLGNGNIRLSWNGNNYRVLIYSDTWIKVNNYPVQGQDADLFRVSKREWTGVNGVNTGNRVRPVLTLKKSGQ